MKNNAAGQPAAPHAGMVELVDSVDLGAVTSVKVFCIVAN